MEDNEPHAVVRLLLKRMESHPEEFKRHEDIYGDRWHSIVSDIIEYGNEADRSVVNAAMRDIRLGEAHEDMMDELVNGPERRRKEVEEREYEQQMLARSRLAQQQQMAAQHQTYQNQLGSLQNAAGAQGLVGKSPNSIWMDESAGIGIGTQSPSQPLTIGTGGKEVMRIKADGGVFIQPKLSSSAINQIKQALGIKK